MEPLEVGHGKSGRALLDVIVCVCVCFSVIQLDSGHAPEPRHVLTRHSLPITDLHCGMMGVQARVVTASLDQTVKVRCVLVTPVLLLQVGLTPAQVSS